MKNKILVVEDNAELADMYKSRFELEGFEVAVVSDSKVALRTAMEFAPDLVLLDVMMPEFNGFDVLQVLRDTDKTKKAKVVLLTALSQSEDKKRASELQADDYLVKGDVELDDVVKCIRKHLGKD